MYKNGGQIRSVLHTHVLNNLLHLKPDLFTKVHHGSNACQQMLYLTNITPSKGKVTKGLEKIH